MTSRIRNRALRGKVVNADEAAALIRPGDNVGMSGFTPHLLDESLSWHQRYVRRGIMRETSS